MAKEHSFDISAQIEKQILKDAYEQAKKIITNRWDFKGITADFDYSEANKTITLISSTDSKVEAMFDALVSECIKRGISAKGIKEASRDTVGGGNVKIIANVVDEISKDDAKKLVKIIKDTKLKVTPSIRGEEVRVVGKSIDDLQSVIKILKEKELDFPVSFTNLK